MRDHVVLYINGARQVVSGRDALLSLSEFLRRRLGLIGTKIVCSEGDCGACSVLIGRPTKAKGESGKWKAHGSGNSTPSPFAFPSSTFTYRPVDSCIQFMFQLDGAHVVTVEGLRPDRRLNAVQRAMVDCHGSQCGFCTPGFVVAMTGLLEESAGDPFDECAWRRGLTGNLCRCTGYTPILDAAERACDEDHQRLNDLYLAAPLLADLDALDDDPIELTAPAALGAPCPMQRVACPTALDDALDFLAAHPDAQIVAGATDVGVRANKSGRLPATILDLNRVGELDFVRVENNVLVAGARATWTTLLTAFETVCPEFARIVAVFGAPQIRHVGTIGGNIANASPIADSLPFLYVMDATLVLLSVAGRREVDVNDFYRGYKQIDLRPGELIAEVHIPLAAADDQLRLYKISRRRDLDISTFTGAIRLQVRDDRIAHAAIALGGVGPTVLRSRSAEQFLIGQPFTEETMMAAGDLAAREITPITDVRGAANYRRQLARNVFLKFYHQCRGELLEASR